MQPGVCISCGEQRRSSSGAGNRFLPGSVWPSTEPLVGQVASFWGGQSHSVASSSCCKHTGQFSKWSLLGCWWQQQKFSKAGGHFPRKEGRPDSHYRALLGPGTKPLSTLRALCQATHFTEEACAKYIHIPGSSLLTTRVVDLRLHAGFHEAEPGFQSVSPSVDDHYADPGIHLAGLFALGTEHMGNLISSSIYLTWQPDTDGIETQATPYLPY